MTLEDYKKIDADAWVMAQNGIVIPRLRDFGLMVDKKIVTEEEINEEKKCAEYYAVESLCFAVPFWTLSNTFCYYEKSTKRLSKYLIKDEYKNTEERIVKFNNPLSHKEFELITDALSDARKAMVFLDKKQISGDKLEYVMDLC